jgi:hypothetical protein
MKIINLFMAIAGLLLIIGLFQQASNDTQTSAKQSTDNAGPNWKKIITPPIDNNGKLLIDANSIEQGKWHDRNGKYCWSRLEATLNGKRFQIDHNYFFEENRVFYVVLNIKTDIDIPSYITEQTNKELPFTNDASVFPSYIFDYVYPGIFDRKKAFDSIELSPKNQ